MSTVESRIALEVSDVTNQRTAQVKDVPPDASIRELVQGLLAQLRLPESDVEGRPLNYGVRRHRDGQHLHDSERVGEALQSGDRVVLMPNVEAG